MRDLLHLAEDHSSNRKCDMRLAFEGGVALIIDYEMITKLISGPGWLILVEIEKEFLFWIAHVNHPVRDLVM